MTENVQTRLILFLRMIRRLGTPEEKAEAVAWEQVISAGLPADQAELRVVGFAERSPKPKADDE